MNLTAIALRNLRQHAFATAVTAVSVALAASLLLAVWTIQGEASRTMTRFDGGFDAVLGARGSKLQLVLNCLFHLEDPVGNLPMSELEAIRKNPVVQLAVPLAMGDNFKGWRIVGTTLDLFEKNEYAPGKKLKAQAGGRFFEEGLREAVVGSMAASRLGLKVGDEIHPSHGVTEGGHEHEDEYVVVGILEPSSTPADRVVWIPLAGVQHMDGHDEKHSDDISAILVKLRPGAAAGGFQLDLKYNKDGKTMTFAWPVGRVLAQLFDRFAWFDRLLQMVAILVALVAAGSISAAIYNSMSGRRRDIAILRALGAKRGTVLRLIILEAVATAALGLIGAFGLHFIFLNVVATILRKQVGIVIDPLAWNPALAAVPISMLALAALAGLAPALQAYRTDVASNLAPDA